MLAKDSNCCPTCGQPWYQRLGVSLPRLKAELLDSIRNSGGIGISSAELRVMHYGLTPKVSLVTIRAHIHQINDMLASTDWEIRPDRSNGGGMAYDPPRWFLVRRRDDCNRPRSTAASPRNRRSGASRR